MAEDNGITDIKPGIRLQSYLAHCGVASRRAAAEVAISGRVAINGVVTTERGARVLAGDVVTVDGRVVTPESIKRYVLLNKPSGYVCSAKDEKGRAVAADLLREAYSERLYSIGRLDMYSTGLIIFTNDGEVARRLSHPSSEIEKEYIVRTTIPMPRSLADDFARGLRIGDVFYKARAAQEITPRSLRVVLTEGKNREIRRVFEAYNVGIKSLQRIRIGCVNIGNLAVGQFRDLSSAEVDGLLGVLPSR